MQQADEMGDEKNASPDLGDCPALELDALEQCFKALPSADLARCGSVCRSWRDVAVGDALWRAALERELHRGPRPRPRRARALFELCVKEPTLQHAAWQARFHSAMRLLNPWRTTVLLHSAPREASAAAAATADGAGGGCPLRVWRCRATSVQRHQQSAWVRFSLPPALATDPEVARGAQEGRLEVRVEARAPSGEWLPLIVSAPFRMHLTDDRAMLLQSHREGLYVWDGQEGDGVVGQPDDDEEDEEGAAQGGTQATGSGPHTPAALPPWWEVDPSRLSAADGPGTDPWGDAPVRATSAAAGDNGIGGGPGHGVQGAAPAGAPPHPPNPALRMLAYLHYEQLLPAVEGRLALPQTFPLAPRPHIAPPPAAASADATPGPATGQAPQPPLLTLQLDFCALREGRGLGRAVATLRLRRWGVAAVQYEAALAGGDVVVEEYGEEGADGGGGAGGLPGSGSERDGSNGGWGESEEEGEEEGEAGGDAQQQHQQEAEEEEEGGSDAEAAVAVEDGAALLAEQEVDLAPSSPGEVLARLAAGESMVDLALFDDRGRLLVGRAGVELWQKEGTALLPVDGGAAGEMVAVHRQLHTMHFLVDGLDDEELWDCVLTLDPAPQWQGEDASLCGCHGALWRGCTHSLLQRKSRGRAQALVQQLRRDEWQPLDTTIYKRSQT